MENYGNHFFQTRNSCTSYSNNGISLENKFVDGSPLKTISFKEHSWRSNRRLENPKRLEKTVETDIKRYHR